MTIGQAEMAACAVKPDQYPKGGIPEIVFAGKSNVGKSTLINCLAGRKRLARSSSEPGKTRTVNFYSLDGKLMFVDLPGYGYAKISRSESAKWGTMVESYLKGRQQIKCVLILADIRRDPDAMDLQLFDYLNHFSIGVAVVATKSDKVRKTLVPARIKAIAKAYGIKDVMPFSSLSKDGFSNLWDFILNKAEISEQSPI
ncbi:MAG: ribosome biogenesis GTP-binding protein YihA/YsxC [Clostridiales bacterium]|jgi:GTP-binding protein|nr:ribosome biogenesis GTP-binding protein YihA/YsxC [Clostridiales bacterium]MDR2749634.1 ribosome biogenesis GTP-binding protein YihA/YsxC [Clostridiales bacterium]